MGEQWKPDRRRKVHRDAKAAGLRVVYDLIHTPGEPDKRRRARKSWLKSLEAQPQETKPDERLFKWRDPET